MFDTAVFHFELTFKNNGYQEYLQAKETRSGKIFKGTLHGISRDPTLIKWHVDSQRVR